MTQSKYLAALPWFGGGTWLAASFALLACAGTETGNPVGDGSGSQSGDEIIEGIPVGGECELGVTELAWDEDWESSGYSGADVAAHLPKNVTTTLRWLDSSSLSYGPELGLGDIEISIAPSKRAYFVAPEPAGGDDIIEPDIVAPVDAGCARMLHVEAEIALVTTSGALDERILTTFQSRMFADTAHAHFRVPVEELAGNFEAELKLAEGQSLASPLALEVELWLSPAGLTGALRITPDAVDDGDNPVDVPAVELGRFPAEQPCGLGAHLLGAGEKLHGFSPDDVLARLSTASSTEWTYEHEAGTTTLSWELPSQPPSRCVGVEQFGTEYLAPLSIESDDGSVSGTFMVNIFAETDGKGGYRALQMAGGSFEQDIATAQDLGERYALTDPAPLTGFDGGMTDFIVDASGAPWGVFRYAGFTQDPCVSDGSQSCQGLVPTVLFGAHLGEPKNGYELEETPTE